MIDAVVFDLDGTLVNLPINWENLFEEIRGITGKQKVRPLTEVVASLDEETLKKALEAWDRFELASCPNITLHEEGMNEYRKYAEKRKGLVTLQGKKIVNFILERFNLDFEVILTREDSLSRNEQLKLIIQKLNVPRRNMLFLGNAKTDALAAKEIGCNFKQIK